MFFPIHIIATGKGAVVFAYYAMMCLRLLRVLRLLKLVKHYKTLKILILALKVKYPSYYSFGKDTVGIRAKLVKCSKIIMIHRININVRSEITHGPERESIDIKVKCH